jgi:hypothetical protein
MPRVKGKETWRRILENADKLPSLVTDGGVMYRKIQGAGGYVLTEVSIVEVVNTLREVKTDLSKLGLELRGKGGHAAKVTKKPKRIIKRTKIKADKKEKPSAD